MYNNIVQYGIKTYSLQKHLLSEAIDNTASQADRL